MRSMLVWNSDWPFTCICKSCSIREVSESPVAAVDVLAGIGSSVGVTRGIKVSAWSFTCVCVHMRVCIRVCMCVCVYVCVIPHSKLACRMQVSKLGGREGCKSVGPPKLVTCNWRAALRQHGTSSHSQQAATFLIFDAQIRKHDPVENVGSCAWHCRTLWSTSMCLKP